MMQDNQTLAYYNRNAANFAENTANVDFSEIQNHFAEKLQKGAHILDFGCGSGRDTKAFLKQGFSVNAVDGSEEMCRLATQLTGIPVKHMLFQDFCEKNQYDGIWACASVLHLPKKELKAVLNNLVNALKGNGVLYVSFKYGDFEGERNDRYFTDFKEDAFREFIKDVRGISIEDCWITEDVRPGRENEQWLNLILRKTSS